MVEYKRAVRALDLRKCLALIDTTCLSIESYIASDISYLL